jgi:hypothetical protein
LRESCLLVASALLWVQSHSCFEDVGACEGEGAGGEGAGVHEEDPSAELYVLAGQAWQVFELVAPVAELKVPTGHSRQEDQSALL